MAIKTKFNVFDIIGANKDYKIQATDKEGTTQTIITSDNAKRYLVRKYGLAWYEILTGAVPATVTDATDAIHEDFRLWILNRQHNIDIQYQALFDYDYSPIENYDRYETEETTTDDDITYGRTDTASGTDRTTYGKVDTESGTDTTTYGKVDTLSGTDRTTYGKTDTESGTDTTTYGKIDTLSGSDRTTYGKTDTESGTDTTTYGKIDTLSGSDTTNFGKVVTEGGDQSEDRTITDDVTETLTKSGTITKEIERAGFNAPNAYTPAEKQTDGFTNYQEQTVTDKDATDNLDITFGKTVTDSGDEETEYGKVDTLSGSDSVGYGHTTTQSGTDTLQHGKVDTLSGSDSVGYGHTTTQSGTDTLQHGKVDTLSGSDSVGYGHTTTQSGTDTLQHGKVDTLSGTDEKDVHTDRELHAHGNIGVTTSTFMISEVLEMRKISLAEMLLDGFIKDYTYYS